MKTVRRSPRRALGFLAGGLLIAGLSLLASWYFFVRDTPSAPVSVAQATKRFHHQPGGRALAATVNGAPVPKAGVYAYTTQGFESLDLGFMSARHAYPSRTVISVARGECGVQMRWEALAERSTTWETCPAANRRSLRSFEEVRAFFGRRNQRLYRCEDAAVAWATGRAGRRINFTCAAPETTSTASGRVMGTETLEVGGRAVKTVRVRLRIRLAGVNRGRGISDTWFAIPSGLIVRRSSRTANLTATSVGDGRYRERYELRLDSLSPRT